MKWAPLSHIFLEWNYLEDWEVPTKHTCERYLYKIIGGADQGNAQQLNKTIEPNWLYVAVFIELSQFVSFIKYLLIIER